MLVCDTIDRLSRVGVSESDENNNNSSNPNFENIEMRSKFDITNTNSEKEISSELNCSCRLEVKVYAEQKFRVTQEQICALRQTWLYFLLACLQLLLSIIKVFLSKMCVTDQFLFFNMAMK